MGKKSKSLEDSEEKLTKAVRESARQIWKAGLGAFTELQERAMADERAVRPPVNALDRVFQDRVAQALLAIGTPTQEDVHLLAARIEELNRRVAALQAGQETAAKKKAARKVS